MDSNTHKLPIILVCGGSCSGKSSFAKLFENGLVLSMDHFYYGKSKMKPEDDGSYNFDSPDSINIAECAKAVDELSSGKSVEIPVYDMKISERIGVQTIEFKPETKFIVVEGIFSFYSPLREIATMKIYLDTPTEVRVARRMLRDVEKGRSNIDTLSWSIVVEKNHEKYIETMKQFADISIPFSYNPVKLT